MSGAAKANRDTAPAEAARVSRWSRRASTSRADATAKTGEETISMIAKPHRWTWYGASTIPAPAMRTTLHATTSPNQAFRSDLRLVSTPSTLLGVASPTVPPSSSQLRTSNRDFSLALHAFTATGALVGMAALVAVLDGSARLAILWLLVAQLIDGVDGPLARRLLPEEATTRFDGYVLDLVIDFVTCVLVPAAFLWQFEMIPHDRYGMFVVAVMLLASSLWFSRTDQMTDDGHFRGFPSAWNMVVPSLWILGGAQLPASVVIVLLSILTLSNVEFAHPVRARSWRSWNLASMTVWIGAVVVGVVLAPDVPIAAQIAVVVGPTMIATAVVARLITSMSESSDRRLI